MASDKRRQKQESNLQEDIKLKKFKHTNEELELAKKATLGVMGKVKNTH